MRFQNINIRNILSEALDCGGIILDVRNHNDFSKGHIPMAINLPLEDIQKGKYSLPRGKVLLVYCENGGSSIMAARILSEKGFKVLNAVGGIKEYRCGLAKKGKYRT